MGRQPEVDYLKTLGIFLIILLVLINICYKKFKLILNFIEEKFPIILSRDSK